MNDPSVTKLDWVSFKLKIEVITALGEALKVFFLCFGVFCCQHIVCRLSLWLGFLSHVHVDPLYPPLTLCHLYSFPPLRTFTLYPLSSPLPSSTLPIPFLIPPPLHIYLPHAFFFLCISYTFMHLTLLYLFSLLILNLCHIIYPPVTNYRTTLLRLCTRLVITTGQ